MCQSSKIEPDIEATQAAPESVELGTSFVFPSAIYSINLPKFLEPARAAVIDAVADRMDEIKEINEIYPVVMTKNLLSDERVGDMAQTIAQTAWSILDSQGYSMNGFSTEVTEFWCQEHHKHSAMEQHVHGFNSQIIGFYFIDVPKGSSRVMFHDPRLGKIQSELPERDRSDGSFASKAIFLDPEPGMCIFANAWLPHSFTRHESDEPLRFIHFNVNAVQIPVHVGCNLKHDVEVI
jgi:uncharacterized protein (TIGR02466 family)